MNKIDKIRARYARARTHDTKERDKAERRVDPTMTKVKGAGDGKKLKIRKAETGSQAARRDKLIEAELIKMEKAEIAKFLSSLNQGEVEDSDAVHIPRHGEGFRPLQLGIHFRRSRRCRI